MDKATKTIIIQGIQKNRSYYEIKEDLEKANLRAGHYTLNNIKRFKKEIETAAIKIHNRSNHSDLSLTEIADQLEQENKLDPDFRQLALKAARKRIDKAKPKPKRKDPYTKYVIILLFIYVIDFIANAMELVPAQFILPINIGIGSVSVILILLVLSEKRK